jgi:hypothetical protein
MEMKKGLSNHRPGPWQVRFRHIKGNNCRLICSIDFIRHGVLVLWVGPHSEFDALMKNDGRQFKRRYGEML